MHPFQVKTPSHKFILLSESRLTVKETAVQEDAGVKKESSVFQLLLVMVNVKVSVKWKPN